MFKKLFVLVPIFSIAFMLLIVLSAWLSLLMLVLKAILLTFLFIAVYSILSYAWWKFKSRSHGQGD